MPVYRGRNEIQVFNTCRSLKPGQCYGLPFRDKVHEPGRYAVNLAIELNIRYLADLLSPLEMELCRREFYKEEITDHGPFTVWENLGDTMERCSTESDYGSGTSRGTYYLYRTGDTTQTPRQVKERSFVISRMKDGEFSAPEHSFELYRDTFNYKSAKRALHERSDLIRGFGAFFEDNQCGELSLFALLTHPAVEEGSTLTYEARCREAVESMSIPGGDYRFDGIENTFYNPVTGKVIPIQRVEFYSSTEEHHNHPTWEKISGDFESYVKRGFIVQKLQIIPKTVHYDERFRLDGSTIGKTNDLRFSVMTGLFYDAKTQEFVRETLLSESFKKLLIVESIYRGSDLRSLLDNWDRTLNALDLPRERSRAQKPLIR